MDERQRMLAWELEEGPERQCLEAMGLAPTYENAIHLQMVRKAAAGDLSAAKYVLDAMPVQTEGLDLSQVSTEELKRMLNEDLATPQSPAATAPLAQGSL